ncbi:ABC transporter ATP-binding protein [Mesorhizobium sp. BH1-1-4]|uniref:ABC transporter ATP-binding protein n=1 Tax=Mesorhizobium sp. BH1-1-4 TaxID=2876662 RepID=UPI001CD098D3|nr:sn-glycerol-3-phosphate ABC transporter ATP-binding protein UgpC [Mesorhizobium sp. BH1-1-4]MBZ9994148.1 sn-glycerol-3-phosphate ABC transporter ATP-binding protein UgpC [Mesorhizobium sp. BH1-1-4]
MTAIELKSISKVFGSYTACRDVNLAIAEGEFITLLGASGCGKTTTLNMVAGLEDVTSGDILMSGRRVNDLSPVQRDVAMVFQNYALYPHMNVARNIGFTLKMRGMDADSIRERVEKVASSLELSSMLDRLPSQLSGGQQQRVAIGRALVREPKIFLFDEPFSNLDASLRMKMRAEVKELHQRLGVTSIFVTHDQEEAMSISDRIAVMNQGRVEQLGTPEEIYSRPATRFVATFIGSPRMELAPGEIVSGAGGVACRIASVEFPFTAQSGTVAPGRQVDVGIRPEHVKLGGAGMPATVRLVQPVGPTTHVTVDWQGGTLVASIPGFVRLSPGASIHAAIDPDHLLVFDRQSGELLA